MQIVEDSLSFSFSLALFLSSALRIRFDAKCTYISADVSANGMKILFEEHSLRRKPFFITNSFIVGVRRKISCLSLNEIMYTSGKDDDRDCNYRRQLHLVANLVSHKIVTERILQYCKKIAGSSF